MVVPGRDPVVLLWAWWVSLALSHSLNCASFHCADSCTIICAVCQRHRYKFSNVLPVMAGDYGDEIPSKSKPQSAGVTSSVNPASLLVFRCGNCINRKLFVLFPRISRIISKLVISEKEISFLELLFNFLTYYRLSSLVLKIFAAASFSF